MRSAAKLNTRRRKAAIDGRPDDTAGPLLASVLKPLYDAYAIVSARATNAIRSISTFPNAKILLKSDGTVDRVIVPERLDAHKLIEEFYDSGQRRAAKCLKRRRCRLSTGAR